MKQLQDASKGLDSFSTVDKWLVRGYLMYLFLLPGVSIVAFELLLDDLGEKGTAYWWHFLFAVPIVMHLGFVINNLKVPATKIGLLSMLILPMLEVGIMIVLFDWNLLHALSLLYAIELLGFSLGLLAGTVFRKADITAAHRRLSFFLVAGVIAIVYFRFRVMFHIYLQGDGILEILGGIACLAIAAFPHIRVFASGKEGADINMHTSTLTTWLTPVVGISVLCYSFVIPFVIFFIKEVI